METNKALRQDEVQLKVFKGTRGLRNTPAMQTVQKKANVNQLGEKVSVYIPNKIK